MCCLLHPFALDKFASRLILGLWVLSQLSRECSFVCTGLFATCILILPIISMGLMNNTQAEEISKRKISILEGPKNIDWVFIEQTHLKKCCKGFQKCISLRIMQSMLIVSLILFLVLTLRVVNAFLRQRCQQVGNQQSCLMRYYVGGGQCT